MIRAAAAAAVALFVASLATAGDARIAAAAKDYEVFRSAGTEDYRYIRYLIAPTQTEIDWRAAISFTLISASLERNLNRQVPRPVADGVWRIDLRALGWNHADLERVLDVQKYPYSAYKNPLYLRADWLIYQIADQSESKAYEFLLFGADDVPADRDEWLKRLGVDRQAVEDQELNFGLIETKSGVAIQSGAKGQRIRILEFFDRLGGYASGTRDFLKIEADNSPLEKIDLKGLKHDGEEWIIGIPKYWRAEPEIGIAAAGRGNVQVYFLANGQGGIVAEAPSKLVEDSRRFKGISSIRNPGSCIVCHAGGLNAPTRNGLQHWIEQGVELKAKSYDVQDFIERWHLTGTATLIGDANRDFAACVAAACGPVEPEAVIGEFVKANDYYRSDVTLAIAADDLGCSPDDLKLALAYASETGNIGGHLSALAGGLPIGRATWEGLYLAARGYVSLWIKSKESRK